MGHVKLTTSTLTVIGMYYCSLCVCEQLEHVHKYSMANEEMKASMSCESNNTAVELHVKRGVAFIRVCINAVTFTSSSFERVQAEYQFVHHMNCPTQGPAILKSIPYINGMIFHSVHGDSVVGPCSPLELSCFLVSFSYSPLATVSRRKECEQACQEFMTTIIVLKYVYSH